ncbi:DUF1622 domain-containing protein [Sphaerisporangium sp. NPDC005288]|uniref:DUF1622 domain-containing protein n=1 Tax=Sphaerisporangium sp. NPDC005288 TaxID=3155114 RepID=UPI00339EC991
MRFQSLIQTLGEFIDLAGVAGIAVGALLTSALFAYRLLLRRAPFPEVYRRYRQGLGRAILLGLEFLVAGDIIRSVAVSPTFTGVGVLVLIVFVRTFLSISLEVELEGRRPWQRRSQDTEAERR